MSGCRCQYSFYFGNSVCHSEWGFLLFRAIIFLHSPPSSMLFSSTVVVCYLHAVVFSLTISVSLSPLAHLSLFLRLQFTNVGLSFSMHASIVSLRTFLSHFLPRSLPPPFSLVSFLCHCSWLQYAITCLLT